MSKWGKIGFLVSGLSLLVLFVTRLILGGWMDLLWVPFGLFCGAFVMAVAVDYKFYFDFLSMRTTKHGMNMGVLILLSVILLVAINFLGTRFDKTFDMTKEKLNTLSEPTLQALGGLDDDLKLLVFYRGTDDKELRGQLKQNFQTYVDANPRVKIQFMDALLEVEAAKKYLESQRFAVVLDYKGKRAQIDEPYDEEKTTSAIFKVTAKEDKTIYFLTGHGERDIDGDGGENIKMFAENLRSDGYKVAKLNTMAGEKLPPPPAVVVIAGPRSPLLDGELDGLREFARAGGHLLILADPGEKHNLALLTKSVGVEFRNNYILNEFDNLEQLGPQAALGADYDRNSDITKKFFLGGRVMGSIFMLASEVARAGDASTELTFKDIVKTTPKAYVSNQPKPVKNPEPRSVTIGVSVSGPVTALAKKVGDEAAKKDGDKKADFSAVVFGDSDFMSNQYIRLGANRDLAMNTVAYLANDANHISVRPKTPEATPLELTTTKEIVVILAGLSLPLCLIILSGFFWYRRRNL